MMGARIVLLLLAALLFLTTYTAPTLTNIRGISPQDESYYKTETIRCKDGSKSFSSYQVNDDFCDCADGTDEPGTSACPNGNFYCKNKGHAPIFIFSSRVNDGICDCCDGSDEYDGKTQCSNTCSQAGKALKDKLEKKIVTFRGGLEVRKRNVEHAKVTIAKEKVELVKLKLEEKTLKDVTNKLKAKKEAIDKAQMEREKEEKARKQAEEEERAKKQAEQEERAKEEAEKNKDGVGHVSEEEGKLEPAKDEQDLGMHGELDEEKLGEADNKGVTSSFEATSGMSKEELGRLVASRWTGENPNVEEERAPKVEEDDHDVDEGGNPDDLDHEHGDDDASTEEEEDDEEDESNGGGGENEEMEAAEGAEATGFTDDVVSSEGPWWVKLKDKVKGMFSRLPIDKSEADRVRKEYHESNTKLRDIQSKISDLEKKMEQDFGKDGEFFSLYGQCFELREKKYTYKVCPYRNSVQVEGHSTTTLGNWDGFKDDHKSMHFLRGDRCWNGPDRSLKVKLRCGSKVELRDVDEPSRCEYAAELSTPAVCLEEKLLSLEQRLQDHEGEFSHDEL